MSANAKLLCFGFFQSFCSSGILYGWPGLVLILRADGMYAELCQQAGGSGSAAGGGGGGCVQQNAALNQLFNVAQAVLTGAMLCNGMAIDRFGPRWSCLGTALVAVGSAGFALQPLPLPGDSIDASYIWLCVMGVGGSAVHLSWFHMSNLFPTRVQTVASIIVSGFVLAGIVFPLFQLLTDAFPGFGRREVFLIIAAVNLATLPFAIRLWPAAPFALGDRLDFTSWSLAYTVTPAPPRDTAQTDKADKVEGGEEQQEPALVPKAEPDEVVKAALKESEMSLAKQLRTPAFVCMLLFFCLHFFRYIWLLGTLLEQFEAKDGTVEAARTYTQITGWALPLAAVGQPFIGLLLDKHGFFKGFSFVVGCGMAYSALVLSASLPLQILMIPFMAVFRVALFSCMFGFVASTFGFKSFGRISGIVLCCGSLSSLLAIPCMTLTAESFGEDFLAVNVLSLVLGVLTLPLLTHLGYEAWPPLPATPATNEP